LIGQTLSHFKITAVLALLASASPAARLVAQGTPPTPRMGLVAVEWNGNVCTFGGYVDDQPLGTVECYEPAADQWRRRARMPTARGLLGAATFGESIYLIGGMRAGKDKLGRVERYEPLSDTWSRVADLPTARNALSAATVGERIYAIGGWGVDDDDRARDFATVEAYDARLDRWSARAPMPAGRSHMAVAVAGSKIYAIGGWMQRAGSLVALSEVTIYDPQMDSWSTATDMPTPRYLATAAVIDNRIYVLGGWTIGPDGDHNATSLVEVFDPATGRWFQDEDLPTPRAAHASAVADASILLFGGAFKKPSPTRDRSILMGFERYSPSEFASLARITTSDMGTETGQGEVASEAEFDDGGAYGRVLEIEQPFGNLRTNLIEGDLQRLGLSPGSRLILHIGTSDFPAILGKDFSDVARGEWVAFAMPDGRLTVARNFASAAEGCGCVAGAVIFLTPGE
jgi:N-acetylneuraminic acid mutarotase